MSSSQKPYLIVIVGPTGVGKTEMAVELARERNGEIISADSMQVYRFMDIGTAKPTDSQRQQVRHHLIDVVNPDEHFNAAMFREMAAGVISALVNQHKTVFVVGGTGLYIKALLGGLFAGPGGNESIRAFYRLELKRFGKAYLYEKLRKKDEQAAARIDRNDAVRIIRALEVLELSGESIVEKQKAHGFNDRLYDCIKIGLTMERPLLYKKIEERSGKMVRDGLVDEVRRLLDMGYHENLKPMRSLGYKHMCSYVKGKRSIEDALKMMQRDTKRYAKRQVTWFGADKQIVWFSPQGIEEARKYIDRFLGCEKYRDIKVLPGVQGTKL
jgi:tRNA dimethylallyltransferase